jgi:hypothetical protein
MREVNIECTLAAVRSLLYWAGNSLSHFVQREGYEDPWERQSLVLPLHEAFTHLLILTEALGLTHTYEMIRKAYDDAIAQDGGISAWENDPDAEPYLLVEGTLRKFMSCLESVYGLKSSHAINKDIIEVLRATQYAITDSQCFSSPPASEDDVHHRIEAVLRCAFPDLDHKPPILKAVKNFIPDTGLPSLRTLIEYKFIQTKEDVKRVVDEILADTRGYRSNEWDKFIFLIYETKRLKRESDWNRLLEQCGTALNIQAIVICGETPSHALLRKKKQAKVKK